MQLFTYLLAPLGIVLGWALTSANKIWDNRKTHNKIRNKVLYNLLEIQFQLRKTTQDFSHYLNILQSAFDDIFYPVKLPPSETEQVFNAMIKTYLKEHISKELESLEPTYIISVEMLSEVDPVMAYYLNGRIAAFRAYEGYMRNLMLNLGQELAASPENSGKFRSLTEKAGNMVVEDSLTEFGLLIIDLAGTIGFITKKKVKAILQKQKEFVASEHEIQMIRSALAQLKDSLQPLMQGNTTEKHLIVFL